VLETALVHSGPPFSFVAPVRRLAALNGCETGRGASRVRHKSFAAVIRGILRSAHPAPPVEPEIRTLIDRWRAYNARRRHGVFVVSLLAVGAAFGAGLAAWSERVYFTVGARPADAAEKGWIGAESSFPVPVRFSDGSTIDLSPGTRARVSDTKRHGASMILETGRLHAWVAHHTSSDWTLGAGPYSIRVTGTAFDLAWDPEAEEFELAVESGVVKVTGPAVGDDETILPGQRLTIARHDGYADRVLTQPEPALADSNLAP
jgi:ferric-dicitrate binding protein FerR (iron transport regulator)